MGRLISVTCPQDRTLNENYQYDATGNITQKTIAGITSTLTYDKANRLMEMQVGNDKYSYQYDKAGRLSKELLNDATLASYQYGYLDKVLNVTRDGTTAHFAYDARGMVASKTISSLSSPISREAWQYDGLALARRGNETYINEASVVGGTTLVKRDLSFKGKALSKASYYLNDHLGTTLASIDIQEKGTAVASNLNTSDLKLNTFQTTAFGESLKTSDLKLNTANEVRYTGKPYDSELGAYVYAYRNYRADLGRWMTSDPAGYPDGTNNYRYAATPNNSFDKWGLAKGAWLFYHDPANIEADLDGYIAESYLELSKDWTSQERRSFATGIVYTDEQVAAYLLDNTKVYMAIHGYNGQYNNHCVRFLANDRMHPNNYYTMTEDHWLESVRENLRSNMNKYNSFLNDINYDGCYLRGLLNRSSMSHGEKTQRIHIYDLFWPKNTKPGILASDPFFYEIRFGKIGAFVNATLSHMGKPLIE